MRIPSNHCPRTLGRYMASWTRQSSNACSGASSRGWSPSRCYSAAASWPRRRPPSPPAFPLRWCWSPCATAPGRGCARARRAEPVSPFCAVGSLRGSREEALAGGGGRARLNREAIPEAIRPCTPQGACGARHWHTRSPSARQRNRYGIPFAIHAARRRVLDECHRMTRVVCRT